ncbi:MAG: HPr family phosphocarrier protein, partial [Desulfosarcina sp.]
MKIPHCEISFSEKVRLFSSDYLKCCTYISNQQTPDYVYTKKLYSKLIGTSQVLEDFLDFHGAKNSEDWYFYRELCAAIRHLSLGAYCQKHILNRLIFYDIPDKETFREKGEETLTFLNDTLRELAPIIIDEALRLTIKIPTGTFGPDDFPGITTGEMLKYDIDDDAKDVQKRNIVKIASDFLSIAASFDPLGFYEPYKEEELVVLVP